MRVNTKHELSGPRSVSDLQPTGLSTQYITKSTRTFQGHFANGVSRLFSFNLGVRNGSVHGDDGITMQTEHHYMRVINETEGWGDEEGDGGWRQKRTSYDTNLLKKGGWEGWGAGSGSPPKK